MGKINISKFEWTMIIMGYNLTNDWNHLSDTIKWLNIQLSDSIVLLSHFESWMIPHKN